MGGQRKQQRAYACQCMKGSRQIWATKYRDVPPVEGPLFDDKTEFKEIECKFAEVGKSATAAREGDIRFSLSEEGLEAI